MLEAGDRVRERLRHGNAPMPREFLEGGVVFRGPRFVPEGSGRVDVTPGARRVQHHPTRRRQPTNRFSFPAAGVARRVPTAMPEEAAVARLGEAGNPIALDEKSPQNATIVAIPRKKRKVSLGGGQTMTVQVRDDPSEGTPQRDPQGNKSTAPVGRPPKPAARKMTPAKVPLPSPVAQSPAAAKDAAKVETPVTKPNQPHMQNEVVAEAAATPASVARMSAPPPAATPNVGGPVVVRPQPGGQQGTPIIGGTQVAVPAMPPEFFYLMTQTWNQWQATQRAPNVTVVQGGPQCTRLLLVLGQDRQLW